MRYTGVTSRGIITPIFSEGDDLVKLVADSIIKASEAEGFKIDTSDIIGVTEAVVGRTQGNYATCEQIAGAVREKLGGEDMGIVFPIFSRNRFSVLLKGIAMSCKKLYVQFSYPADEVGNALISYDEMLEKGINPYSDNFTEAEFRAVFGKNTVHEFTGIDYIEYYKSLHDNIEIIFSNDPKYILNFTKNVICSDIHTRFRTYKTLEKAGADKLFRLDQILTEPYNGSGYNEQYGLLGSNKATEDKVKLFPRDCETFVNSLQDEMHKRTGKLVEVMVYGDGGFKDPVGGIWELADPVISPAYTPGLEGKPNEIKMKYFADNEFGHLRGAELRAAIKKKIAEKETDLKGNMYSQGTTPRQISDLVGSLCDLTSGSGDRGTPVVYIKGYFSNYATE
ncbi:MAG: F420-0--gamma-glutamyl ligase [Christensenellaceae bacterium]|nr:F420-0--gamma-glutamyl ligase [Christensenellaceae bacterium]